MLDATQRKGWGGVGHVNVPCTLHTCWMLRNVYVEHMLDATQLKGWGGVGHVNVPCTLLTCWMLRN